MTRSKTKPQTKIYIHIFLSNFLQFSSEKVTLCATNDHYRLNINLEYQLLQLFQKKKKLYVDFNSVYRNQINNFDRLLKFMDRSRMTLTKKWLVLRITIRGIKLSEREERARNLWCVRAAGNVRTRSVSAIDF